MTPRATLLREARPASLPAPVSRRVDLSHSRHLRAEPDPPGPTRTMDRLTQDEVLAPVWGTAREPERLREHADTCPTCHARPAESALALAEEDESPLLAADASSMAPLGRGSLLLHRLVIPDRSGHGGMETVWLAHDNRRRREVALKFVDGADVSRARLIR